MIFRVTSITYLDKDSVKVGGGYAKGGPFKSTCIFDVKRQSGDWVVIKQWFVLD